MVTEQNSSSSLQVFCIGTADTKLEELRFLSEAVRSSLSSFSSNSSTKVDVTVVDVSTSSEKEADSCGDFNFVSRKDVLSFYSGTGEGEKHSVQLPDDRGKAIAIMNKGLENFLNKVHNDKALAGVVGLGGSGGTSLLSSAFRSLPIGIPKLIVSTVASGQTEHYVGASDLVLFPSVVDVCGINSVSRVVLSNAGAAFAGMVVARLQSSEESPTVDDKVTVGITMFGVTTPCVNAVKERLTKEGYETLVFHATGVGGRAMEDLVKGGFIQVEMIAKAHKMGLLTTPYAFNPNEALQMAKAGADVIVAHMGLTTSGSIGAKTALSLEESVLCVQAIADATHRINPDAIVLCHGGPISGPDEAEYVLKRTKGVHGFYGASSLERLPVEKAITATVQQYKSMSMG
nr:Tm-1 protein [Ipomoea batatas]